MVFHSAKTRNVRTAVTMARLHTETEGRLLARYYVVAKVYKVLYM